MKNQKLNVCEPRLLKLKMLRKRLYSEESTSENLKKIEALEKVSPGSKQIDEEDKIDNDEKSKSVFKGMILKDRT